MQINLIMLISRLSVASASGYRSLAVLTRPLSVSASRSFSKAQGRTVGVVCGAVVGAITLALPQVSAEEGKQLFV